MPMPLSMLLGCALALGLAPLQTPPMRPKPEPPRRDAPSDPSPGVKIQIEQQHAGMQGVWRLREFTSPDLAPSRRFDQAYVMVSGDFLSLEVHVDWVTEKQRVEGRMFDGGLYHFEIRPGSRLEMRSLISSYADELGTIQFRPVGFERNYRIDVVGDRMTWLGERGQRSVFERMAETRRKRDAFGRPLPEPPAGDAKPADGLPAAKPPEKKGGERED